MGVFLETFWKFSELFFFKNTFGKLHPLKEQNMKYVTTWKVSKYGVIPGPYFTAFGLNTEVNGVNIRIQSEYRKIRTRNNSVFGHFSRNDVIA